jgi:hypothetical protein
MYNLIFVDVGFSDRIPTYVHKMNVINGDHVGAKNLTGNMDCQIDQLINIIIKDMPDKIIFDKAGHGFMFYDMFMQRIKFRPARGVFSVDSFGLITYEVDDFNGGF